MKPFETFQLVVQDIGVVAVILTLYVYYRQMRTMERQLRAVEREMAARMRPWVGLFGFRFDPAVPPDQQDVLRLLLRNCGTLPAQRAQLTLALHPLILGGDEVDSPIHWEEVGVKALVPGEEGNYGIELSRYPQFAQWRESRRDVMAEGSMVYALDQASFRTEFEAVLLFSEDTDANGRVKTRWRNQEVV